MYLITVWGSSGAGKTTVAMALASAFAAEKKDTLVLSVDTRTPALPVLLPMVKDVDGRNSVGSLLSAQEISEASLKDRMMRHPKNSHIFCMGLASGETAAITYSPPTRTAAVNLFHVLMQAPFDYVIVDCDSSPLYDQTTLAALEYAQTGLMVLTPDVKGYEHMKAQMAWLTNSDIFHLEQFIKIASPVFPFTPINEARTLFGGFSYELPHTQEVAEKMIAGELLAGFSSTAGIRFGQQIKQLATHIQEVNSHVE